jgi:hypothetical protein
MQKNRNVWRSFQGCFVAVGHYVISILAGVATWHFMNSFPFPPFVVWTVAAIAGMLTFQVIYILNHKIGDKP